MHAGKFTCISPCVPPLVAACCRWGSVRCAGDEAKDPNGVANGVANGVDQVDAREQDTSPIGDACACCACAYSNAATSAGSRKGGFVFADISRKQGRPSCELFSEAAGAAK
jgi:hypothetical protein